MSILHPKLRRLTELMIIHNKGELSTKQTAEFTSCMNWLIEMYWEDTKITALSHLASETNDEEWQAQIINRAADLRKEVL